MSASLAVELLSGVGASVLAAACLALVCGLTAYSVERSGRAWRSAMTWSYFTKAVKEYGVNHPEERAKAHKREGISDPAAPALPAAQPGEKS